MNQPTNFSHKPIPDPSWNNVRTLYRKLSDEFHILTDAYRLEVSNSTKINLDHLIIVIDDVDQCVDETPDRASRDSITQSLIDYLENADELWCHPKATKLMIQQMGILKIIITKEGIQQQFVEAAKTIFEVTELKRHTDNEEELIDLIKREGEATALMPLSILKISQDSPFGIFFTRLCKIMGIADLVFDAREDYRSGYIRLRPSLKLFSKLNYIVLVEGLKLLRDFPRKTSFLLYCFRFTIALIRE